MRKTFDDMYDTVKEECKRVKRNALRVDCSECRVIWLCKQIPGPLPCQWPERKAED